MLTADTITEEQIHRLRDQAIAYGDDDTAEACRVALGGKPDGQLHPRSTTSAMIQTQAARARCAEILNARCAEIHNIADTITDEQIRAYHDAGKSTDEVHEVCRIALYAAPGSTKRRLARAQVAEWINARKERP